MNTKQLLLAMALCLGFSTAQAADKTDITATYVGNASMELDDITAITATTNSNDGLRGYGVAAPKGWTKSGTSVTSLIVTKECYTDNNFGLVTTLADGNQAYYMRMGWSTGTTTLQQTIANLPAGKYMLTADVRTGYANTATSSYKLFAGTANTSGTFVQGTGTTHFPNLQWTTVSTTFEQKATASVNVGMEVTWLSGGSCIMIDNVRLYKLSDDYVEPDEPNETSVSSPTEGVITNTFVDETTMKADLLQMLADFAKYMKADFQEAEYANSVGEACGCFKGENTMANDERGVRPNADLSMICAFLSKYGKGKVTLPLGVTWDDIDAMALKSLIFAYSTHKANKLKVCSGGNYWGSVSASDHVWESSLWAMSVAYSAFFQWDKLTTAQKGYIEAMLKAECNYELTRTIPTGYNGDTKAEENGWEANILAATLGLFPNDELAPQWYQRLREFAINSYSQADDASDNTIIDPDYDNTTVANLYKGKNLYNDYTLQNHNYFHTSYQNVVMQELGEAALALKLFQGENEKWKTIALKHNNDKVMKEVLNWLALADGELAMPNGNDWSLFLYDQITSYSTQACFEKDPDALMLENLAYKYIKARQTTTADGSWLLNADVGARRMGVEAHRVMMTWLMHEVASTADVTPTQWEDFNNKYSDAKYFSTQKLLRASNQHRFSCFSWSEGLKSYTGYFAPNSADKNKILVPYRANNTGNYIGWYNLSGKATNATSLIYGRYNLKGNSYVMNGALNCNDNVLNNRFAMFTTPGNAILYTDYVYALQEATITKECGGLLAISVDPLTKTKRTLYYDGGYKQFDGTALNTFDSRWINIDNQLGVVVPGEKTFAFGDRSLNNSIYTAKLYSSYSAKQRNVSASSMVDRRNIVYYSNITADTTSMMSERTVALTNNVTNGWNGVIAPDPDGTYYMLLANFRGISSNCKLSQVSLSTVAPVFKEPTIINDSKATAQFVADINYSIGETIKFGISGNNIVAMQDEADSCCIYIFAKANETIKISAAGCQTLSQNVKKEKCIKAQIKNGEIVVSDSDIPETILSTLQATGISSVALARQGQETFYNLSGQRVGSHAKGIVIDSKGNKWAK